MTFNAVIEKLMPEIKSGSDEPFIIYRDNKGEWHGDFTKNQYGDEYDWVEDVKDKDLFAVEFTGKDFAKGSYPYVYDAVLVNRFRKEYQVEVNNGTNIENLSAMMDFFKDNIAEFESSTTNYLTTLERPFRALMEMCPYKMKSEHNGDFNKSLTNEAIDRIEEEVYTRLGNKREVYVPNKLIIEGYEERHKVQLAGHLVIFAENEKADEPYMVCYCKWDNPLNFNEYYNICTSDDYIEAMALYAEGIKSFVGILEMERDGYKTPKQTLTNTDCIPNGLDEDLKGRMIVIKPESLADEYKRSEHQIKICTGGFGASPNSRGNAVYCKDLYSDKNSRFERYDVLGIIDPYKLPEWAARKIALTKAIKEPDVFEYCGYHFKPYRNFRKGEVIRRLKGDSRPWKYDIQYEMRNMSSDRELGLTTYDWWKKADYTSDGFINAAGESIADIYINLENGKLYVPYRNELFQYTEPVVKTNERATKKPKLQDKMDKAKEKVAEQNAKRNNEINKPIKRKDQEVE